MSALALILWQLALPAAQPPPDIEIRARIKADRVEIKNEGKARISLCVEPGKTAPVEVNRSQPAGQQSYRNLTVDLRAAAQISDPSNSNRSKSTGDVE